MKVRMKELLFVLAFLIPTLGCIHFGNLILALAVAFVVSAATLGMKDLLFFVAALLAIAAGSVTGALLGNFLKTISL